jgi:riboflavin kinase / FMN adenylyltransferase
MQIVRDLDAYDANADLLLTIGVFDGVHRGHREVLQRLREQRSPSVAVGAMTFEHHPLAFLHPGHSPKALTTMDEKINLLDTCGLDLLFLLPFDERIQQQQADAFLRDVIVKRLRTRELVVGENWRFGKDRTGDVELATRVLKESGCRFDVAALVGSDGQRISSSRIRQLITDRRFQEADELLGTPFTLRGIVIGGDSRGHALGFPTANLRVPEEKLVPTDGVYACSAHYDGADYRAVVSIGNKPTFEGHDTAIEAYVLGFNRSIYGEQLALHGWTFLREQERFANAQALVDQIKLDVSRAGGPSPGP